MSHNTKDPKLLAAMKDFYRDRKGAVKVENTGEWNFPDYSILLDTDSYKVSMWKQYPPGTEYVNSYIESRGGRFPNTVFFGLQAFLQKLERPITQEEIDFADRFWTAHGEPFNREGWQYILDEHGGRLPIRIEAIEEGRVVPVKNALVQIVNTDPKCFWLTTWVETALLRAVWYPTTVATLSWSIKQIIQKYLEKTCDNPEAEIGFKLHDFGSRGVSSSESAMLGGMAHILNFMGTDTAIGMVGAMQFYGAGLDTEINPDTGFPTSPAFSIPAAEHSTMTAWGEEGEIDAFRNMVEQFGGPGRLVAVVSDSYDIYRAASEHWGEKLKNVVQNMGGTLVVRPDSGDPTVVPIRVVEILGEKFGYTVNSKGYKVLAPCVRVIQGDGIDMDMIDAILRNLTEAGWSAENLTFGMGGALLQKLDRDTMKWAMKASAVKMAGHQEWTDVFKDPVTDAGKKSKKGRLGLILSHGPSSDGYYTRKLTEIDSDQNLLKPVFHDGEVLRHMSWDRVRALTSERDGVLSVMPFNT